MNIAFFLHVRCNRNSGGVERVTVNLSESLHSRGHNIFHLFFHGKEDGVSNFKVPIFNSVEQTAEWIDTFVKIHSIDIIFDQNYCATFLSNKFLRSGVKIIRCLHSNTRTKYATQTLIRNFNFINTQESILNVLFWLNTPKRLYNKEKYLFNISCGIDKLILLDDGFYLPQKVDKRVIGYIPNGIKSIMYEYQNKKKQILFVGRLIHNPKNTRFLVRLWAQLYKEFPDWEFIICGDGPDLPVMKYYVSRHKLERIFFKGNVEPSKYYQDSSILVLPSFYEGFGMVLIEGMQYGCVPVVFDVCSSFHKICKDMNRLDRDGTPRECGVIVKAMDNKLYVNECRRLMSDPVLLKKMAEAAMEHVQDYDLEKITDKWEALFEEILTRQN